MTNFQNGAEESALSTIQDERLIILEAYYDGPTSLKIVKSITSHGANSWLSILNKITAISIGDKSNDDYLNHLENQVMLGHSYTPRECTSIVANTRRSMKMKPLGKDITKASVNAFLASYVCDLTMSVAVEGEKQVIESYTPVVNLNNQI